MPVTTKDRDELVTRALQKLVVVGSGQSPEVEDTDRVDEIVDATLADLAARGVCYVPDVEEIDVSVFEWVAEILADNVASDFGKQRDPGKVLMAENRLRAIKASGPSFEVQKAEYF